MISDKGLPFVSMSRRAAGRGLFAAIGVRGRMIPWATNIWRSASLFAEEAFSNAGLVFLGFTLIWTLKTGVSLVETCRFYN